MPDKGDAGGSILINRFSLKEKLLMRSGWLGFMTVGAYAIYRQDPLWAYMYVIGEFLVFALVILPFLCAHCPYPYKFSTCLYMPHGLVQKFYAYRGPEMGASEKIAAGAALASMVIIPQFWLIHEIKLLVIFWLAAVPSMAVFPLHYCSRCRHHGCPMNKAKG